MDNKTRKIITINIVKFGTGAFITVAFFCLYYVIYQKVAFKDLFSQLSGEDYKDMSITKKFNLIYYRSLFVCYINLII